LNTQWIKKELNQHQDVIRILRFFYNLVKNPKNLQHKLGFKRINHKDEVIYIIRPNTEDGIQGLMSLFIQTLRKIDYANSKGYIPVVDFKNYLTQYYDGMNNVWENYFTQPSEKSLSEAYSSSQIILSGISLKKNEDVSLFKKDIFFNKEKLNQAHNIIENNIVIQKNVSNIISEERQKLSINNCIGVYIRGTDYVALKPVGEYVQPEVDEVINKMKIFQEKYPDSNFFIVTEDYNIYKKIKKEFSTKVRIVSFDKFIGNYDGSTFLSKANILQDDKVSRGMDYLVKILLLSECRYLISSITMGSIATFAINGGKYEEEYIFDLGVYE